MSKKEYLYFNRDLQKIKGEKWKDVPSLEGYFMISNYGRVKRLEYELEFTDGRRYRMNSLIMKPTLAKSPNHFLKDTCYFLRITLTVSGNIYNFSIGRLLYFCFIRPFSLKDENLLVVYKDGNGQNIRLSNLNLVNRSERQLGVISRHRSENILLRRDIREKGETANREKNGKQISRYDLKGNRMMTYPTIVAAAEAMGVTTSGISGVLRGRKVTATGYFWRYGCKEKIDIDNFLRKRKETNKCFLGKSIIQYNVKGKKIATHISINEASRRSGACSTTIGKAVNGKARTAGGFIWKKAPSKNQRICA